MSGKFNGMGMNLGNISKVAKAVSRSISAENVYGEKGRGGMAEISETPQPEVAKIGQQWVPNNPPARELGRGWKARPCINLAAGETATLMDISGPGAIRHIWMTVAPYLHRDLILRMYWDNSEHPSVETPLGDFFCQTWSKRTPILALPINVNSNGGMNCYFPMPFRKHARVTIENRGRREVDGFFYTFNYTLNEIDDDEAYFHASYRQAVPVPWKEEYVILDGVEGSGQFVGLFMGWQQNTFGWWGEGEFKAFLDGDDKFPTICGTGTEDYFGGAWGFGQNYSAPFLGYPLGASDGKTGNRHTLYRFHIMDPIRFERDIRVHMQALGLRRDRCFAPLRDHLTSVAYWYQTPIGKPFPPLPSPQELEVNDRE